MSIEIIQDEDKMPTGFINIGGSSFPGLGKLPKKKGSIIGIAFNSQRHLDAAIAFLQKARRELYGDQKSDAEQSTEQKKSSP